MHPPKRDLETGAISMQGHNEALNGIVAAVTQALQEPQLSAATI